MVTTAYIPAAAVDTTNGPYRGLDKVNHRGTDIFDPNIKEQLLA
jgi:hypothetical protein